VSRARAEMELPSGVQLVPLEVRGDERGELTEIFRDEWPLAMDPVQWNLVRSREGTLRGVHVHWRHSDYLVVVRGVATIGLLDLRPGATTPPAVVALAEDRPAALLTPAGVAHGFYFHTDAVHVYAVSSYWDAADELGCRWDDPELGIPWPATPLWLSERDRSLPSLAQLRDELRGRLSAPGQLP